MDNFSKSGKAEVLVQALPYIRRYNGETIVVKYGGNAMINEHLKQQVMEDIVLLWLVGVKVVLVHGGGPEISDLIKKLGKKTEFVEGLRVTDKETMEIVQMALAGKVNKTLVNLIEMNGGDAIGLSGIDDRMIEAEKKDSRLGYVGEITKVNVKLLNDLLDNGYIPVISTVGCDNEGNAYNINADTAAAKIAGALNAKRLIMMTDIAGILENPDDPDTLISELSVEEAEAMLHSDAVSGGMIPKIQCCVDAIRHGVHRVVIMDGRVSHSIIMEILTNEGSGTMVTGVRTNYDDKRKR